MNTALSNLATTNVEMAKSAALLEAGRIANKKINALVASKAPLMFKGYVDTPLGRLATANLVLTAVQQLPQTKANPIANRLAQAAVASAYQEVLQSFDVEGMVNSIIGDKDVAAALRAAE